MGSVLSACLRIGVLGTGLVAMSACATLDEDQCRTVDWSQLGYDDGQAGRDASHIDRHRRACERHGIPVAASEWRDGWEDGIRRYCTPQNGLNEGRAGRSYANSCPADVRAGFEEAYRVGKSLHDARQTRDRHQDELDRLLRDLREERVRDEIRKLQTEISVKRDEVNRAERRLREAERDYEYFVFDTGLRG